MTTPAGILRTPEARFKQLPDYSFAPHYVSVGAGLRMHYVDEGEPDRPVVLLLHGEPSWSYLYRNIIPPLAEQGYRVIAPDLIGFGKSDKLPHRKDYTYTAHTTWLRRFLARLELTDIHLFAHDWGGMIALRIVAEEPDLFATVIVSYAFLFTGTEPIPDNFREWQRFSESDPDFRAGTIIDINTYRKLPAEVQAAYNAPFPNDQYLAGARQFPLMVPTDADDPEAQTNSRLREKLKAFDKPFLTLWGDNNDPIWHHKDQILQKEIPGARGMNHQVVHAHHFLPEDQPDRIGKIILDALSSD